MAKDFAKKPVNVGDAERVAARAAAEGIRLHKALATSGGETLAKPPRGKARGR